MRSYTNTVPLNCFSTGGKLYFALGKGPCWTVTAAGFAGDLPGATFFDDFTIYKQKKEIDVKKHKHNKCSLLQQQKTSSNHHDLHFCKHFIWSHDASS